jgi:site-specific recombinase XerD
MASLLKPTYTRPLPEGAVVQTRNEKGTARSFVRVTVDGKAVWRPLTKKGDCYLEPADKWYGQYTDLDGRTRRVPLSENKTAAQQMLNALVRKAELGKVGITDPFEEHRKRPLAEHLADFRRFQDTKGGNPQHVAQVMAQCQAVLDGTRASFVADLDAGRVADWLADARRQRGMSINTSNHYLLSVRGFCRWMVKDRRIAENPLAHLSEQNSATDVRHARRALAVEELQRILDAALASTAGFRGLTGRDRHFLYLTAMSTGFRVSELASMTPEDFTVTDGTCTATVAAAYTKNRQPATQPLPMEVADALAGYLAEKQAGAPVWPGAWTKEAARMLRGDLEAAGIPYTTEGPNGPEYADFHALRHSYITNVVTSGVNVKLAQTLARHSTVTLTIGRYTHVHLHDRAAAVENLPRLLPRRPQSGTMQATGTDGACTVACTKLAQAADNERDGLITGESIVPMCGVDVTSTRRAGLRLDDSDCKKMGLNEPNLFQKRNKRGELCCFSSRVPCDRKWRK